MANTCVTNYVVTGDKAQLMRLHRILKELGEMDEPYDSNGWGKTWCGCLVARLGVDWKEVGCRGQWLYLEYDGDEKLEFTVESAWAELSEWRHLICEMFDGLEIYYRAEEPGCRYFRTNDSFGVFFPDRYMLDIEDRCVEYYNDLPGLCADVSDITGEEVGTLAQCEAAVNRYTRRNGDIYGDVAEFEVVDD